MPTVTVPRNHFYKLLGRTLTDNEFADLCFEFGIELDQITSEKEIVSKQRGGLINNNDTNTDLESEEIVYKIEIPANRYDLLCIEGIVSALRIFLNLQSVPPFTVITPSQDKIIKIIQKNETTEVREFIVGAVLRNITFDNRNFKSFMDLQDKLHQNIGRKRTLASIGTHDLDTIKGPFTYEAKPKNEIEFIALRENKSMNVDELFNHYKSTPNCPLEPYLAITESAKNHPVIYDSNRIVCSLPPIINGEHSKITLNTRNVLIECTGTDLTKLTIVLNTVIAMFSIYCQIPYQCEAVEIVNELTGKSVITPQLKSETFTASVDYINKGIGINLPAETMITMLARMQLNTIYNSTNQQLTVTAPITRSDILHSCDIMEDVAIAYGYNNIIQNLPATATIGRQLPINKLTDLNRDIIAQSGFNEVLTWALCSIDDSYSKMNKLENIDYYIRVSEPKTAEFEMIRISLLPGLLKALSSNKGLVNLPIKLFEISDVAFQSSTADVGAINQRRAAALYCGNTSGFEIIHGLVDRIMMQNNYFSPAYITQAQTELDKRAKERKIAAAALKAEKKKLEKAAAKTKGKPAGTANTTAAAIDTNSTDATEEDIITDNVFHYNPNRVYTIRSSSNSSYFPGRSGDIYVGNDCIGSFGILHPTVLTAYDIGDYPCSALEINLEYFLVPDPGHRQRIAKATEPIITTAAAAGESKEEKKH